MTPDILCIGSVLWDQIGRTRETMKLGYDVPGRITRLPGGVAMNIAMTLIGQGLRPALLSVVGQDPEGDALVAEAARLGLITETLLRSAELPTDNYMAIESPAGLIAAIADAHSLEAAGTAILAPLTDGRLGRAEAPWTGPVALDGNLTEEMLAEIATSPLLAQADLRVAPASPGKARRLRHLRPHPRATFYVNKAEAELLTGQPLEDAATAAQALCAEGYGRALVTDGPRSAAIATPQGVIRDTPPQVPQNRVTGAGDTFMAAHIAAEISGAAPAKALSRALAVAAHYVSGENT